jgi:hypothetical protein
MDYQSDALYGPDYSTGSLPPSVLHQNAMDSVDLLLTGIANAGLNALNVQTASQQYAQQQVMTQQSVPAADGSKQLLTLLLVGGLIWMAVGGRAA